MVDLKPCPFCGGAPLAYVRGDEEGYCGVECRECNGSQGRAFIGVHADSEDEAASLWNRRSSLSAEKAEEPRTEKPALDLAIDAVFSALIRMGYAYEAANDMRNAIYHAHRDACAVKDPAPTASAQGETPTTNACVERFLDVRGGDYIATKEIDAIAAVRSLCLASRAPSSRACMHRFSSNPGMYDTQHRYCEICGVAE